MTTDDDLWEPSPADVWAEGCRCNVVRMPPCGFCTSHDEACEWPDADCRCREARLGVVVPAIVTHVPFWDRADLRELDRSLDAMYGEG